MPSLEKDFNELTYKKASRVMKAECLTLPPFIRQQVTVSMGPKQAKAYEEMRRDLVAYLNSAACVAHIALTKSLRLQQIVSGFAKLDDGREIDFEDSERIDALEEVLEMTEGHKVIVWSVFKQNYGVIEKLLERLKIKYARLVGGMTDKERQAGIDAFQNDSETRVMLANQRAGGVGVTLTAATYAVFFSRNFSLEDDLQAEARNYRGGSERHASVTRIDIVCPDSIDEVVLEALKRKEDLANNILAIKGRDF
jgi:non-specific serine/threonine protein kinase